MHKQTTLGALPPDLQGEVVLVASLPQEAKQLKALYPKNEVLCAKNVKHIGEKRHWIMQNLTGKIVFMLDDDLAFFLRCPVQAREWDGGAWRLRPEYANINPNLIDRMYPTDKRLLAAFKELDKKAGSVQAIGIGHRRHNDKQKESWSAPHRMMYALGIDPQTYKKLGAKFSDVQCREDFHVTLALLRKGICNYVSQELLLEAYGAFSSTGGCSAERSIERSNEQCERLAALHPGFVKVVDRAYTGSIPRKEVVVYWKKAYESSH